MNKLTYIPVENESYPIRCDNLVLESLQEEFGSIKAFEMALIGLENERNEDGTVKTDKNGKEVFKRTEPSVKAINFALPLMVNEGYRTESEQKNTEFVYMEEKEIIRKIDLPYIELSGILHEELFRCFKKK